MEIVHWAVFLSLFAVGTLPVTVTVTTQFAPIALVVGFFFSLGLGAFSLSRLGLGGPDSGSGEG